MANQLDGILDANVEAGARVVNTPQTIADKISLYFRNSGLDVDYHSRSANEQGVLGELYRVSLEKKCGSSRAQREIIRQYTDRHQELDSSAFNQLLTQYASTLSCGACSACQLKKPYSGGAK
jgi:hypothetical protein